MAAVVMVGAGWWGEARAFASGKATGPVMRFRPGMAVRTVCFRVVNPAGTRSTLFGQRFIDGPASSSTPAIVLVHGAASSTVDWDLSPKWSVARALASAGYVVFSYDRLGFAKSAYFKVTGGGNTLTTAVQRRLLHQIVEQVGAGSYRTSAQNTCARRGSAVRLRSPKVIIIGHSSGGWVVAGYPGEYHDVAAMIQADIAASFATPSAPGGSFATDPAHPDYYEFFQTRQDCERFNTYPPGVVKYVIARACAPPFVLTPWGEIKGLAQTLSDDAKYIPRIGRKIPVLLTSGRYDTTETPADAREDLAYYHAHCGCEASQFIVPNAGHLFMAHKSLPLWINHVVKWLRTHGLSPHTRP
jgi:pimeloyl-ACP methyl ester carboxylesterase